MDDLGSLRKTLAAISPVDDATWNDFSKIWTPFTAKRKEIISAAGEPEKYFYFVAEGVQRIFYLDDQNREATILLTYAPSFGGVLDSFMLQKPSIFYYETLTPSRFLRANHESIQGMIENHKSVATLFQKGITQSLSGVLERMVELQCFTSEEKFKKLLKRSPHILTLVPHKYLANYLGVDATNFSKMINSIRI